MRIEYTVEEDFGIFTLYAGEVSYAESKKQLQAILDYTARAYIVDFQYIDHLVSSELGIVIHLFKQSRNQERPFMVCNVSENIMNLLTVFNLTAFLKVQPSLQDAKDALR